MSRTAKIITLIGDKKTGKTYELLNIIRQMVLKQKKTVIILSPMQPEYQQFPLVSIEDLNQFKTKVKPHQIVRCEDLDNYEEFTEAVGQNVRNAAVIYEDSTRYIPSNPPREIRSILYNNRNLNIDLIFVFHTFAVIPMMIMQTTDIFIIKQTKDNLSNNTVRNKIAIHEADITAAIAQVEKENKALKSKHPKGDPLHGINYATATVHT